jgi:hypothetical protein
MWRASLAIATIVIANPLMAGALELCVQNPSRLDEYTLRSFRSELTVILTASGRPPEFVACRPGLTKLIVREQPPEEETSALGRTRVENGQFVPEIEIFVAPVAAILGTRLPAVLGRALARVATHELGHLLRQDARHSPRGVMTERLGAAHLMAPDHGYFRLPSGN